MNTMLQQAGSVYKPLESTGKVRPHQMLSCHVLDLGLVSLGATCFNELYLPLWHGQQAVPALITRNLIHVLYTYIAAVF